MQEYARLIYMTYTLLAVKNRKQPGADGTRERRASAKTRENLNVPAFRRTGQATGFKPEPEER